MPGAASVQADLQANVDLELPKASAALEAGLEASVSMTAPPSFEVSLAAATQLVTAIQAQIALGIPSVSIDLDAVAGAVLELQDGAARWEASAAIAASVGGSLGATASLYRFDGKASELGGDLTSELSGDTDDAVAVILVAKGSSITALQALFAI